jgi:hypothetical protein
VFFTRPIAGTLGVLTVLMWVVMAWRVLRKRPAAPAL